jgi:membrane protein YdbS with pleckstrin-like domain
MSSTQNNLIIKLIIPVVIILGFTVLFFFPEPESNFLAYFATALFFIILTIFLIIFGKRKNQIYKK